MRLLWFNLATDVDDPVLGFTSRWIQAIATKVERIHVITMRAGRIELPENVRCDSVGKEVPWCTTPIEAESSLGPDSHHPIISLSGIPSAVMVWRCCTALAESEIRLWWWPRYVRA